MNQGWFLTAAFSVNSDCPVVRQVNASVEPGRHLQVRRTVWQQADGLRAQRRTYGGLITKERHVYLLYRQRSLMLAWTLKPYHTFWHDIPCVMGSDAAPTVSEATRFDPAAEKQPLGCRKAVEAVWLRTVCPMQLSARKCEAMHKDPEKLAQCTELISGVCAQSAHGAIASLTQQFTGLHASLAMMVKHGCVLALFEPMLCLAPQ